MHNIRAFLLTRKNAENIVLSSGKYSEEHHMSGKALFKYETVLTSLSKHPVSQLPRNFFSHRQTGKKRLTALWQGLDWAQNSATEPEVTIELQFIYCNEAIYTAADAATKYF